MSPKVPCVAAILRNSQGRVLLQQRDDRPNLAFAGCWTLPGGTVEDGEVPDDAIHRELMEEIGLEISLDLWKVYERPGPDLITIVQYVYTGQTDQTVLSSAVNEGQGVRYFALKEIDKLSVAYGFDSLLTEYFVVQRTAI